MLLAVEYMPAICPRTAALVLLLWHSEDMKALKSRLANELLSDPSARAQLRQFLVNKGAGASSQRENITGQFVVRRSDGVVRVEAKFVPKATKAD